MSHFIKKLIITGIAAVTALGVLTACTKMEESSENGESAAAEEEIPPAEGAEDKEAPAAEDPDLLYHFDRDVRRRSRFWYAACQSGRDGGRTFL